MNEICLNLIEKMLKNLQNYVKKVNKLSKIPLFFYLDLL